MVQMYAFKDKAGEMFLEPFAAKNSAVAVRVLKDLAQNQNHFISKNPQDYALYWIGSYNEEQGVMVPIKQLELVAEAADYKIEKK